MECNSYLTKFVEAVEYRTIFAHVEPLHLHPGELSDLFCLFCTFASSVHLPLLCFRQLWTFDSFVLLTVFDFLMFCTLVCSISVTSCFSSLFRCTTLLLQKICPSVCLFTTSSLKCMKSFLMRKNNLTPKQVYLLIVIWHVVRSNTPQKTNIVVAMIFRHFFHGGFVRSVYLHLSIETCTSHKGTG